MVRRAKIVATLGPAVDDRATLRAALEAGIDVVRLNFSHGSHDDHARRLEMVKEIANELGRNVGALADLQGPKIRLGVVPDKGVNVPTGSEVYLHPGVEELDSYESEGIPALPVVYEELADDVTPGSLMLIDDGSIRLVASAIEGGVVRARVVAGGVAKTRKGLNLPGVKVSAPCLTEKDIADLEFAMQLGADWVALSFVREPSDILDVRTRIHAHGGEAPIIAKLERPEAIENLVPLVEVTDAVMVARGDLGVEIGPERVPAIQKEIISKANAAARPVITATEMLDSMINSPRPTRAEASDVANAIFDGTDAVMLSGETAAGKYPVEAVRTMARIVEVAERSPHLIHPSPPPLREESVPRVIAKSAVQVARDVKAKAIVVFSITGWSVQLVSKMRPTVPLLGVTPSEKARGRTCLMWGTEAGVVPLKERPQELLEAAEQVLVDGEWAENGDQVVVVTGPPGSMGGTSRIWVHRIGDEVKS